MKSRDAILIPVMWDGLPESLIAFGAGGAAPYYPNHGGIFGGEQYLKFDTNGVVQVATAATP
jgi:hypothetical protein